MPDRTYLADQCWLETSTPAFTCYMADLLQAGKTKSQPNLRQDLTVSKLGFVVRAARYIARRYPPGPPQVLRAA
jgi:hypothetical protein